jgi:hypothetical protein
MTKYYALWYYSYCDGARGANAISEHPERLIQLHEENSKNPESQWYNYDEKLYEMKTEPIECYTYNSETKKIEPYDDSHKTDGYDFYAFSTLCNNSSFGLSFYDDVVMKVADTDGNFLDNNDFDEFDKGQILVYLSKGWHKLWQECSDIYQKYACKDTFIMSLDSDLPTFCYTDWPSHSPVEPNVYYEDGIMNA